MTPNSTITTEITPENTGRSIKNRSFFYDKPVAVVQAVHREIGSFRPSVFQSVGDDFVLQFHGGGHGNGDGIRLGVPKDDVADAAAQQFAFGIGEQGFDLHRSGRRVHHTAYGLDASLRFVQTTVVELQAHFRHLGYQAVNRAVASG